MIVDRLGRQFRNLRLSLTAACNYACTYCVPDGKRLLAAASELEAQEMVHAVKLMMDVAGIEKLRITGGEPLLSPKFDVLLPEVMRLGLQDVAITTNGQLLPRKAQIITDAGVERITVSLDTLDADGFREIARSGDLATVLKGVELMQEAGLRVKMNMVPMRHKNDDQILPMLDFCLERGIELRFIELMSMGHLQGNPIFEAQFMGMQDILDLVATRHEFARTDAAYDSTAARFSISNSVSSSVSSSASSSVSRDESSNGVFGIIANESEPFCKTCTRLRISSNGHLFGCLSNAKSYDLAPILQIPHELAMVRLQSILGSALHDKQLSSFSGEVTVMKFIGG